MKRKNSASLLVILFLLLVSFFYSTEPGIQEFIIFSVLSAFLIISAFLTRHYYMTDNSSLKQRVIYICIAFVKTTIFYVAVIELTGFSLDYSFIALFFIALSIFTLWESLNLTMLEKGVLVLTLVAILGVRIYEGTVTTPSTAVQLYRSELREGVSFKNIQDLLLEDYREDFTLEKFRDLEPYLQQFPLRYNQPALLEFKDGQMVMVEVSREDQYKPLRISNIELLPEEIASYFRYYPLEIERKADFPEGMVGSETIIETRGAFVSRASFYQERDWYEQLVSVFGEKEVWDELWGELDGLLAPEGPVRGAGINNKGYLEFTFYEDWKVDKEVLDEIYALFRDKASKHDITDLPVVFKYN